MKKILLILFACTTALIAGAQTAAKSNEPTVDTKGAEALKKEATVKTDIPDSKRPAPGKVQQDATATEQKTVLHEEKELAKGVKVEASKPLVARDRPKTSTIDDSKQPPARTPAQPMVSKEAQKKDN